MTANRQVMPDDHSELEPPLPIPNRTVKRYRADDSAVTSVKVGYRQAISPKAPDTLVRGFFFYLHFLLSLAYFLYDQGIHPVYRFRLITFLSSLPFGIFVCVRR